MVLKEFLDKYKHCPICNSDFTVVAKVKSISDNKKYISETIEILENKINIHIKSDYFINSDIKNNFNFSVSIVGGQILHCDMTNQFVSLYDLNIYLIKSCSECDKTNNAFWQNIILFYDRKDSVFASERIAEGFCISDEYNDRYNFSNNYDTGTSMLYIQKMMELKGQSCKISQLPFDKFDFSDKQKLLDKLKSIAILS